SRPCDYSPSPARPTVTILPLCHGIPQRVETQRQLSRQIPGPWRSDEIGPTESELSPPHNCSENPLSILHQPEILIPDHWSLLPDGLSKPPKRPLSYKGGVGVVERSFPCLANRKRT